MVEKSKKITNATIKYGVEVLVLSDDRSLSKVLITILLIAFVVMLGVAVAFDTSAT